MKSLLSLALCLLFIDGLPAEPAPQPVYAVAEYDPKRDPDKDLKAAIQLATKGDRRILIIAGGNWCGWCRALDRQFKRPEIATVLAASYVIMKVNVSDENGNLYFLQHYPDIEEYPHFYVLDAKGKLLHTQPNRAFERLGSYRSAVMLEFLKKWTRPSK